MYPLQARLIGAFRPGVVVDSAGDDIGRAGVVFVMAGGLAKDFYAQLRQRGVFDLANLRYVPYQTTSTITIAPDTAPKEAGLVDAGLRDAGELRPQVETRFSRRASSPG